MGSFSYWLVGECQKIENILRTISIFEKEKINFAITYYIMRIINETLKKSSTPISATAVTATILGNISGEKHYRSFIELGEGTNARVLDWQKNIIMPVEDYYRLYLDFTRPIIRTSLQEIKKLPSRICGMPSLLYRYMDKENRMGIRNRRRDIQFEGQPEEVLYDSYFGREM
jgi:hypothetical protein